jgi:hypothetical protein
LIATAQRVTVPPHYLRLEGSEGSPGRRSPGPPLARQGRPTGLPFGRRRIGKTKLIGEWLRCRGGLYSQAIEGSTTLQVAQTYADLREHLGVAIEPKTWQELFSLFDAQKGRLVIEQLGASASLVYPAPC